MLREPAFLLLLAAGGSVLALTLSVPVLRWLYHFPGAAPPRT
jgi:hypothetical protein